MPLGITHGLGSWRIQQNNVERHTDNAAYTAANPEDTLLLAGPPRFMDVMQSEDSGVGSLLAIGMTQTFQFTSQVPLQPMQAIGSSRLFFTRSKSQTSWRLGRLLTNGRNLLRVLYHNAVAAGLNVGALDEPPVPAGQGTQNTTFYANLDSELFYVPFGIAVLFRDRAKDLLGAFYFELCMVNMYTLGFTIGQNMVMEDISGLCDRVVPFSPSTLQAVPGLDRKALDEVIGFTSTGDLSVPTDWITGMDDLPTG
jgi:hypothetical protein